MIQSNLKQNGLRYQDHTGLHWLRNHCNRETVAYRRTHKEKIDLAKWFRILSITKKEW